MSTSSMTRGEKIAMLIVAVIALTAVTAAIWRRAGSAPAAPAVMADSVTVHVIDTTKTYRADSLHRQRRRAPNNRHAKSVKQGSVKQKQTTRDMTLTPDEEARR